MWINKLGSINNTLVILGTLSNPVYLFGRKDEYALIEGGLTRDAESLLVQIKQYVSDLSLIKHWFITHSHYDHCGAVEYLYPYLKNVTIYTSENTLKNLKNKKYVTKIKQLNALIFDKELIVGANLMSVPFTVLKNGERLKTNTGTWVVLYTPGHSKCLMSIYNQEHDFLFVSDALGEIINEKKWFPLAFENVGQFIESIHKLDFFHSRTIILGHNGILTDEDALYAPTYALKGCKEIIELVSEQKDLISKEGLVDTICTKYKIMDHSFIPDPVYRKSLELLISNLKTESFV